MWNLIKKWCKTGTDSKPNLQLPKGKHLGEGWIERLGLAYTHYYMQNQSVTRIYYIAWGNFFSTLWSPLWGNNLKKNGYMYMYNWFPLLYTWNQHKIVTCTCKWVTFLYSRKLTERCKPAITEKIKIIMKVKKKLLVTYTLHNLLEKK